MLTFLHFNSVTRTILQFPTLGSIQIALLYLILKEESSTFWLTDRKSSYFWFVGNREFSQHENLARIATQSNHNLAMNWMNFFMFISTAALQFSVSSFLIWATQYDKFASPIEKISTDDIPCWWTRIFFMEGLWGTSLHWNCGTDSHYWLHYNFLQWF